MYTEKEVENLLKMQKKICSDIASANWGNHVGKSVLKSPDVPLVKPCSLGSVIEQLSDDEIWDKMLKDTGAINSHNLEGARWYRDNAL